MPEITRSFFVALKNDCSPQDRHREPKLVWLEPSSDEILGMSEKYSAMSVKETAM